MSPEEMIYTFRLKADKIDSKNAANIKIAAIIYLLNEGMMSLVIKRYGGRNTTYRAALEEIQKRRDEFQRIIVPDEMLSAEKVNDEVYIADITKTKHTYMFLLRTNMYASKDACKDRKLRGLLTETDDLDLIEGSPLDDSSFEWGDCRFRIADDKLRMRSDGSFIITKARIDYLRYPKKIDIAGYKNFDGTASETAECELPKFLHSDIVDEALFVYADSFTNADMRARLLKIANNE